MFDHFDATIQGEEFYSEPSLATVCPDCGTSHKTLSDELACPGFADAIFEGDDDSGGFAVVTLGGYTADYDNMF